MLSRRRHSPGVLEAVAGFTILAGLMTITPGMDTALIARSTISRSPRYAAATAAGIQAGTLTWGAAAATGAAALLAASQTVYQVLVYAGVAYMAWIGIGMIRDSLRQQIHDPGAVDAALPTGARPWRGFGMGLLTNLSNPKVGVFYVATIPQFVPDEIAPLWMGSLLAAISRAPRDVRRNPDEIPENAGSHTCRRCPIQLHRPGLGRSGHRGEAGSVHLTGCAAPAAGRRDGGLRQCDRQ